MSENAVGHSEDDIGGGISHVEHGADTSLLDCSHVSSGLDLSVSLDADLGDLHLGDGCNCA